MIETVKIAGTIKRFERLGEALEKDDLTGLFVRKQFHSDLVELGANASAQHPLSLLFVDLDFFKEINDQHGHEAGDEVLAKAGHILESVCTGKSRAYRCGGDEFAILLPDHGCVQAAVVAEEVRSRVEQTVFRSCPEQMAVSIGIACYPETVQERSGLFLDADTMMYRAKDMGGNRMCPAFRNDAEGRNQKMRYMRGDITSRVEALELWMSLRGVNGRHIEISVLNDSDEEISIEGVSLRIGTLYLVQFGKPEGGANWIVGARSQKQISTYFDNDPTITLQYRDNPVEGQMLEIDIVLRGRVLGRLRTFSHTILAQMKGQSIQQYAPL